MKNIYSFIIAVTLFSISFFPDTNNKLKRTFLKSHSKPIDLFTSHQEVKKNHLTNKINIDQENTGEEIFREALINLKMDYGVAPPILRPGMWFAGNASEYIVNKFIQDNLPAIQQITLNPLAWSRCSADELPESQITEIHDKECLLNFKKFIINDYFQENKSSTKLIISLKDFIENNPSFNSQISFNLAPSWFMPRWLSRYNYKPLSNPICEAKTAKIVKLDHSLNKYCDAYNVIHNTHGYIVGGNTLPRNFKIWNEAIIFLVKFLHEKEFDDLTLNQKVKGLNIKHISFHLGHEPDKDFFGTEDEFFSLYSETAKSIKHYYPDIEVGGIGTQTHDIVRLCPYRGQDEALESHFCPHTRFNTSHSCLINTDSSIIDHGSKNCKPMLNNFIQYVGTHDVPLNIINWHQWGEEALFNKGYKKLTYGLYDILKENNLDIKKIKLYPADWNIRGQYCKEKEHDILDSHIRASFSIATLHSMWNAGIKWHSADFDVTIPKVVNNTSENREGSSFNGCWGIATENNKSHVIKPVYNAFRMLSKFGGIEENSPSHIVSSHLSSTENIDLETLHLISSLSSNKDKLRLLITNYPPFHSSTITSILIKEFKKCYSSNEDHSIIDKLSKNINREAIALRENESVTNYLKRINKNISQLNLMELDKKRAHQCMESLTPILIEMRKTQKNPQTVRFNIRNFSFNTYKINQYNIDESPDHSSNSCSYNKNTEIDKSPLICGKNGNVDLEIKSSLNQAQKVALSTIMDQIESLNVNKEFLKNAILKSNDCLDSECLKLNLDHYLATSSKSSHSKDLNIEREKIIKIFHAYRKLKNRLFYYGKFKNININHFIDDINNSLHISLEGSLQKGELHLKQKNEKITFDVKIKPYSTLLIEITPH